ncbi:fibrinogen alpha chain-like [Mya arenaria]|uniref:fibrinogen alpha chain-like n=1 Tax=Mya arenaria TaxID=6604 RepID=UPI0022DFAD6D|nr:fibrinogen alpha chain-like [Mya arenaria]
MPRKEVESNFALRTCHIWCFFVQIFVIFVQNSYCQPEQCTSQHVLSSLGDHGDRLYSLENLVQNLTNGLTSLQNDVNSLNFENAQLKDKLKKFEQSCHLTCDGGNISQSRQSTDSTATQPSNIHTNKSTFVTSLTTAKSSNNTNVVTPTTVTPDSTITTTPRTTNVLVNTTVVTLNSSHTDTSTTSVPLTATVATSLTILSTSATTTTTTATPTTTDATTPTQTTTDATTPTPTTTDATTPTQTTTDATTPTPTTTDATTPTPTTADAVYEDCDEVLMSAGLTSGSNGTVAKIRLGRNSIDALCKKEDGRSWLVIQKRVDGSVDFDRTWQDYKNGFGDIALQGNFWLGNEKIYELTSTEDYMLRISMWDWGGNSKFAEYEHFGLLDEANLYSLSVASYSGNAGDSFHYPDSYQLQHHMMAFSTSDRDHDHSPLNCAQKLKGGWWFNGCYSSNLNGPYLPNAYGQRMMGESFGVPTLDGTGIEWYPYRHRQYSMKAVEMKIAKSSHSSILG